MKRFIVELIGGLALLGLGIILSASNTRVVFIGLIVTGGAGVVTAFVNLFKTLRAKRDAPREKKKMKKGVKITLGIVAALAVAFLSLYLYDRIHRNTVNANYAAFFESLADLDVESAENAARKLQNDDYVRERLAILRGFVEAVDAGDWQGALELWNSAGSNGLSRWGKAPAAYFLCRWKLIEPDVQRALDAEDWSAAWNLASDFYWEIYPAGNASTSENLDQFEETYSEEAALWRQAFDAAGAALFEAAEYEDIDRFLQKYTKTHKTARKKRFGDFSWYEAAEARW